MSLTTVVTQTQLCIFGTDSFANFVLMSDCESEFNREVRKHNTWMKINNSMLRKENVTRSIQKIMG